MCLYLDHSAGRGPIFDLISGEYFTLTLTLLLALSHNSEMLVYLLTLMNMYDVSVCSHTPFRVYPDNYTLIKIQSDTKEQKSRVLSESSLNSSSITELVNCRAGLVLSLYCGRDLL